MANATQNDLLLRIPPGILAVANLAHLGPNSHGLDVVQISKTKDGVARAAARGDDCAIVAQWQTPTDGPNGEWVGLIPQSMAMQINHTTSPYVEDGHTDMYVDELGTFEFVTFFMGNRTTVRTVPVASNFPPLEGLFRERGDNALQATVSVFQLIHTLRVLQYMGVYTVSVRIQSNPHAPLKVFGNKRGHSVWVVMAQKTLVEGWEAEMDSTPFARASE